MEPCTLLSTTNTTNAPDPSLQAVSQARCCHLARRGTWSPASCPPRGICSFSLSLQLQQSQKELPQQQHQQTTASVGKVLMAARAAPLCSDSHRPRMGPSPSTNSYTGQHIFLQAASTQPKRLLLLLLPLPKSPSSPSTEPEIPSNKLLSTAGRKQLWLPQASNNLVNFNLCLLLYYH